MKDNLISREALLKDLRDWGRSLDPLSENVLMAAIECVCERIEEVPAVRRRPARKGKWGLLHIGVGHLWSCSHCGNQSMMAHNYCPHCGAKMSI